MPVGGQQRASGAGGSRGAIAQRGGRRQALLRLCPGDASQPNEAHSLSEGGGGDTELPASWRGGRITSRFGSCRRYAGATAAVPAEAGVCAEVATASEAAEGGDDARAAVDLSRAVLCSEGAAARAAACAEEWLSNALLYHGAGRVTNADGEARALWIAHETSAESAFWAMRRGEAWALEWLADQVQLISLSLSPRVQIFLLYNPEIWTLPSPSFCRPPSWSKSSY